MAVFMVTGSCSVEALSPVVAALFVLDEPPPSFASFCAAEAEADALVLAIAVFCVAEAEADALVLATAVFCVADAPAPEVVGLYVVEEPLQASGMNDRTR